jgi:ribosomal protein L33
MSFELSLYDQLKSKKENGEQLDFKKITYEELYKLWHTESKSDAMIGEIYNVTKGAVRKKRDRLNMKMYDIEF